MRPRITNVTLYGKQNKDFLCWVSICLEGNFIVKYIRIIKSRNGKLIVAMPSRKSIEDEYKFTDYAHPANSGYRKFLDLIILRAYIRAKDLGADIGKGYVVAFREKRPVSNK